MSTGSVGTIGSVATGQLQQTRGADAERTTQEVSNQARGTESSKRAEAAGGVGEMEQEGETSERDADGRRLWERPGRKPAKPETTEPEPIAELPRSKDPTGESGGQLDLTG